MNHKTWFYAFLLAAIICLAGRLAPMPYHWQLDYISKPLLMPLLFMFYKTSMQAVRQVSYTEFITSGLLFAWLGDVMLMLADGQQSIFIVGLLCFLVMQLQYIFLYSKKSNKGPSAIKKTPLMALPSILLAVGFYFLLFPQLDIVLKIAVGVYALALGSMTVAAVNRHNNCSITSFRQVTIGAFAFMISDMMIGMDQFLFDDGFYLSGFWIMLTYVGGQYMIFKGLIVYEQEKATTATQHA